MKKQPPGTIDYAKAQRMLDDGASVLQVAHTFGVSPQAVYYAIGVGRLEKP